MGTITDKQLFDANTDVCAKVSQNMQNMYFYGKKRPSVQWVPGADMW